VVLLIVYRSSLSATEEIAVRQCRRVLGAHPLIVVAPEGLRLPPLLRTLPAERFPTECFRDVRAYNELMLSPAFYHRFSGFGHLLIHQLDAFVFRDELLSWCNKGHDYIGAPWINMSFPRSPEWEGLLHGLVPASSFARWSGRLDVGNGGFSLRRVDTMLHILDHQKRLREVWGTRNEDGFWGIAARLALSESEYRTPDKEEAMAFATETQPADCYRRTGRLPFGCHAWNKIDPGFWLPHIQRTGCTLPAQGIRSWPLRAVQHARSWFAKPSQSP